MKVLITGGCGFIGSNLALCIKEQMPNAKVFVFDNLKRRGSEKNLEDVKAKDINFLHGDIRCEEDFDGLKDIDLIIDASAEPSVSAGLNGGAKQLVHINLIGTINILNLAVKHNAKLIFLSTSRVYPIQKLKSIGYIENDTRFSITDSQSMQGIGVNGIDESFPLDGYRSLYGASKLSSELLIEEYQEFYNLNAIINRCGVIAGPRQMGKVDQGFMVLWVAKHYWKGTLNYIGFEGMGKQVRDVLHIEDLANLILLQIQNFGMYNRTKSNVGGGLDTSYSLQELSAICQEVTGNSIQIGKVIETQRTDIPIYISNNKKIEELSGWKPKKTKKEIVVDIFEWIKSNESALVKYLNPK